MAEFGIIADIAFAYELIVFVIYNVFLYFIYQRKKEKTTALTKIVFNVFVGYSFGILFSAVSKMFNSVWGGVPYESVPENALWLVARLHSGRFGFIGVIFGTIYSYELYLNVFKKEIPKLKMNLTKGFGYLIVLYLAIGYKFDKETGRAVQSFEIVAFALLLLYLLIVYIPFMKSAFRLADRIPVEEEGYKRAIKSLGYMALSFIMIFSFFLIDRVMLLAFSWAYSTFYFLGWVFVLTAIYSAYSGYIKPAVKQREE